MEYQVEELSPVKRKVSVAVPAEEVDAALSATAALYRKDADVKGFRKGKVPLSVIESRFRKQIYSEAANDLVNLHINEIMAELAVTPVSGIDLDGKDMVRGEAFDYSLTFEVLPAFDLPGYEGAQVDQEVPEVKEDEVDAVVERIRGSLAETLPVAEDRAPENGEIAVISFKAWDETGTPLEGVKAENFELTLGERQALPEFEDIVRRLKVGETGEDRIQFPEDFINPDLAGKKATMEVTLHALKVKKLPEIDDEFAKKAGGFANVQAMRDAITKSYMESRKQLHRSAAQKRLLDSLVAQVDYPLPEAMVEQYLNTMIGDLRSRLERQGRSLESLGKTGEQLRAEMLPEAESMARSQVFLLTVAAKEDLSVSEHDMDTYFTQMGMRSGEDPREIRKFYEQNNLMFQLKDRLLSDKAMEHIYDQAEVKEVPASEMADAAASEAPADAAKEEDA